MPAPKPGDVRSYNGETRMWNGRGWELIDAPGPIGPQTLGFSEPPPTPSGRTDKQDFSAFKNFLTGAGSTLLPMILPEAGIPMRLALSAMGGAAGRGVGNAMEPNPDESMSGDVATGAAEGAALELAPTALSGALKFGGRALGAIGRRLNVGSPWIRGLAAREMGMPAPVVAAAVAGPPVADAAGRGAESLAAKIGPETTSQRLLRFFRGGGDGPAGDVVDRFAPNVGRSSREVPGFSMPDAAPADVLPQPSLDRFGGNRSGFADTPIAVPAAPGSMSALERAATQSPVERFGGQASGYEPGIVPDAPGAAVAGARPGLEPFGGQASGYEPGPIPASPTQLTDAERRILEGSDVFDPELGMTLPRDVPDFTYEAGHPDIPGLTIGPPSLTALSRATGADAAAPAATMAAPAAAASGPMIQPSDVESALLNLGFKRADARSAAARAVQGSSDIGVAVSRALRMLAPVR